MNDAVTAYGTALVDDPDRIGKVAAVPLDEVLFARSLAEHRRHVFPRTRCATTCLRPVGRPSCPPM